jgi:hypothetical protein
MRGKYLNAFGKYIERIYDSMKRRGRLSAYSPYAPGDVEVHVSPVTVIRV